MKTWPIASEVVVESKHWRGRMVVEDVQESEDPYKSTVTYTLKPLDGNPPLLFGLLGSASSAPEPDPEHQ
ncbi:hypothetical protein SAMN04488581_2581 [Mycolicibacterium neoaurum]|uniref:hypothetical protein n=1 Tax=Mycolicibacterium neoaurum TaxID=1795 RepID=UPI00088EBE7D|nr:hypothetical protein [Mycolicibacterium neoaurum]SDD57774.1 hypothetical protein SAMN04488581_2581 [Mycolicibacterium neoaurum]